MVELSSGMPPAASSDHDHLVDWMFRNRANAQHRREKKPGPELATSSPCSVFRNANQFTTIVCTATH